MAALESMPVVQLYRSILKAAKHFPSRKRDRIIQGIKQEFHDNKDLSDTEKIKQCLAVAHRGLSDLQSYLPSNTGSSGDSINVTLKGATH